MNLLAELRRRNVIRMAGLYLVGAWLTTQVAGTVLPMFGAPEWIARSVVILLAIGFIPALLIAWLFELTPQGLKRDGDVAPGESIAPRTAQPMNRILIALLLVALGYFVVDKFVLSPQHEAASRAAAAAMTAVPAKPAEAGATATVQTSIAVLPFLDMSQAKDQEYFSDGLSEELLNLLAQLPQLKVIARTSSFSFKGRNVDVGTIAKALNVANVLEGSVRKSGNVLRITAQLIRTSDSTHLWSQTYDRELTDIFKVQDDIANAVVGALKLKLLPAQTMTNAHWSRNVEAYNELLAARALHNGQSKESFDKAIAAYRRAIALDSGFAPAFAGLAWAQSQLAELTGDTAESVKALADAQHAIDLAPDLADGYAARGTVRLSFKRDWAGAQADLAKALELNPADTRVQLVYSRLLITLGRLPEAIAAGRKSTELDPVQTIGWALYGRVLAASGDLPAAKRALQRALEISSTSDFAHFHLGITCLLENNPAEALASFRQAGSAYGPTGVSMAEFSLGHLAESQRALDDAIQHDAGSGPYQIAEAFAWRDETDRAFEWLERAYTQVDSGLAFIKTDPLLRNIKSDPRFAAMLRKMGLPE